MGNRMLLGVALVLLVLPLLYAQHEAGQSAKQTASVPPQPAEPHWPQFNGARGDNRSPDQGLLRTWPAGGPRLLWTYEGCGKGFSSVSVAGGMIFTAGAFEDTEKLLALNMAGELLWTAANGKAWKTPWPGSRSTPTYSEGMVYHLNGHGRLSAYDAKTGKDAWSVNLPHERLSQGGYAESVVIDGNNLICMPGAAKEFIVALDKRTGKTVWVSDLKKIEYDRASYVTPILVEQNGRKLLIHLSLFQLAALDAGTGKVQWSVRHKGPGHCDVVAVSPIWADGCVFMSKGYGKGSQLFTIDPSGSSATKTWHHRASDSEHGAAVLHNGHIYVSGNYVYPKGGWAEKEARNGSLYCLDVASGEEKWAANTGRCTLTYADGMLYGLSEFGTVYLIEASPKECKIVGQLQIPRKKRGQTLVHPVVVGGRMYVRDHNVLYVYDVKGRG